METTEQICPEWHEQHEGQCTPITKTYKEWADLTLIGQDIPNHSWSKITYQEFRDTINETLKDLSILNSIREEYCQREELIKLGEEWRERIMRMPMSKTESLIDIGKEYQREFNKRMAGYNS